MLQFIDSRSRVLEPTTLCCYREMLRNKLQYIMDIKIEDLTARDIQIAINVDASVSAISPSRTQSASCVRC